MFRQTNYDLILNIISPLCLTVLASLGSRKSLSSGLCPAQMAGRLLAGHFLLQQYRLYMLLNP